MSSDNLTTPVSSGWHHVVEDEKVLYVRHINETLKWDADAMKYLPIQEDGNDLFEKIKSGVLLCKLINQTVPGTINEKLVVSKERLNPWEITANHSLCLKGARAIGCQVVNIGSQDLVEGKEHLVLGLLRQIILYEPTLPRESEDELTKYTVDEGLASDASSASPPPEVLLAAQTFSEKAGERGGGAGGGRGGGGGVMRATSPLPKVQKALSPEMLRLPTSRGWHNVQDDEKALYVRHINKSLCNDPHLASVLPISEFGDDLFEKVKSGVLLCKLINQAVPGTINEKKLVTKKRLNPWEVTGNHVLCLNGAKAIGCQVVNIGTQDLLEGKHHLVLGLLNQIIKVELLTRAVEISPELEKLIVSEEDSLISPVRVPELSSFRFSEATPLLPNHVTSAPALPDDFSEERSLWCCCIPAMRPSPVKK